MEKPADNAHPIHDLLKSRWSPRAFGSQPVAAEQLRQLFEAARWAASSFNEQPWRFVVATREDSAGFERALGCLVEKNQVWAKGAPVLVLTFFKKTFSRNGTPNRVAMHDLGLAIGNLTAQATSLGLCLHQMGGILPTKIRETYAVPDDFEPATAIAIGHPGDPSSLPDDLRQSELAPRTRNPLATTVFADRFGEPSPLLDAP